MYTLSPKLINPARCELGNCDFKKKKKLCPKSKL